MISRRDTFNLPNTITLLRIGVVPFLFILLSDPGKSWSLIIAGLFVVASITDFFDGYIARKYQMITTMGKFLDPIADKIIVNSAMILLIPIGRIPAWIVAITIIRDLMVDVIRSIASSEGIYIQASRLGKQKTVAQIIAVTALIIHYPFLGFNTHVVGTVVLYVAFIFTIYSGIDYLVKLFQSIEQ
ncbi:MAG TPA: CDP-diacylglycerol--glycerol-3-phosphate 3-phosphatidyltransferase [Smithella sp.]|jgi:CDP-diacylglycerol--glycerol-3-phosphate 3-phosphatidyltransferase|nr:CDP-diacylglycerol--glycerol-3-phosphate 3-phosphatidyltransferase [Smithella sp.]NMC96064.1 CDP-diacylglycerol--glycerol-3-phosphate 3-phosphatidyltransferase [Deltaproteobacteria bacterium]OQC53474.1 MAG: CDP-diacylglycerol--glycerol-3-phosphate 3-phosphatidyltransferase [Deltaproteobacteria bacterium ADurb.Bin022]HNQ65309.1 CDP-diacylglycerol--glycerol-3-phosphate 3-phosphatidyltransferase [Smithella sp.]HOE33298.1 CDP-diacylglycerol--glycerol-3-phosphate 3-phosphatidyltransferase [Smithe